MRIISCNLNGIRSAGRKGFFDWFGTQDADILCVQELKAHAHQVPASARPAGYEAHFHFARRPGYAGVGLYCRRKPDRIHIGLSGLNGDQWADMDAEGRYVQADFGRLSVISVYFPSGSSSAERQAIKFSFLQRFLPFIRSMKQSGREIILCGDINIAHRKIDLKNWRGNQKNSGFLPEERAWMDEMLASGFVDVFRALYPEKEAYTWWSNRGRAREKDVGWRIDYQIATPAIAELARSAYIHDRMERFSDHAPLTVDYRYEL
ncbi:MAG: exodeoxyribonuclease III [Mariprofundaceae bacterium]|nr:exodeoxyribonuclease III [Mariprofundaceae bacterium]